MTTAILVQLSEELGGEAIDFWIPSGWGAAAAVGFSIAGRLSDIFGRRIIILIGQAMTIIGGVVACTAHSMNQLIAGEVILGASIGTVSVAYAGKYSSVIWSSVGVDQCRHLRNLAEQVPRCRLGMDGVEPCNLGYSGHVAGDIDGQ